MQHRTLPITSSKLSLNSFPYFMARVTTTCSVPLGVQHIGTAQMKCNLWKSSLDTETVKTSAEMSMGFILARL
jgi:hypothetical protein